MEVALAARPHLQLQNTIHWIKSIAIDREAAGAAADLPRDLAVGHYKPINSDRFLNDCQEFIFHFTPGGRTPSIVAPSAFPTRTPRTSPAGVPAAQPALPRQHLVHPLRHDSEPRPGSPHPATFPPRVPEYCLRLHGLSRVGLVMDPFLGLGSTAVACAARASISSASRSMSTTAGGGRADATDDRAGERVPTVPKVPMVLRSNGAKVHIVPGVPRCKARPPNLRTGQGLHAGTSARWHLGTMCTLAP